MIEEKDQLNQTIRLAQFPSRIVSLVPSQTELLSYLDLDEHVVGITKFCIHPNDWFRTKTRVGGTKNVDIEKVMQLQPDLIIGNKEENTQSDIEALSKIAPVWMSDVNTLSDALMMIQSIGKLTDRSEQSTVLIEEIETGFANLKPVDFSFLYFMWKDPYFTVGPQTFIHEIIRQLGGRNLQESARYPEWEFNQSIQPDVVFLSSEPFPFNEEHLPYFQNHYPNAKIMLVDGEFFSWYGSKLKNAPKYFEALLHQLKKIETN